MFLINKFKFELHEISTKKITNLYNHASEMFSNYPKKFILPASIFEISLIFQLNLFKRITQ